MKVQSLRKHPNADKLSIFSVYSREIITSSDTQIGTTVIYFPVEVAINHDYLRLNNEYRKTLSMNVDEHDAGGFFEEKGRVKAISLRGNKSEGYIVPISTLEPIIGDKWKELENHIDEEFDTVDGILLAWKYQIQKKNGEQKPGQERSKRELQSKLLPNQFRLHGSTSHLDKNLHKIKPDDIISITWKFHGTSFVSSKILCKRKLNLFERLLKYCGVAIRDTEYSNIYSSRHQIKNEDINKNPTHYYEYDLWGDINNLFRDKLRCGETLYGEAVGYTKTGKCIQNSYDYRCKPNEFATYIYKITYTTADGNVVALPYGAMAQRCEELGTEPCPLIYYGRADGFYYFRKGGDVDIWRGEFLKEIKSSYVYDQDSQFCNNKVPEEGVVVVVEGLSPEAFKEKSFAFKKAESKALDEGVEDMEEQEAVDATE